MVYVEALIKTFEQYGVAIDSTEDALRTFYDRLGDARADPNIESAQIFRQVGLDIEDADVKLEDFLGKLQGFNRQSQIFIKRQCSVARARLSYKRSPMRVFKAASTLACS